MTNNDKIEKAKRLVHLTGVGRSFIRGKVQERSHDDPRSAHEKNLKDMQIELRAKHMSSEQLDALLDFYSSDMGKSILDAQERIRVEASDRLASLVENSSTKPVGWVPDPGNNRDGDDS